MTQLTTLILLLISLQAVYSNSIFVSQLRGMDTEKCGAENAPCKTLRRGLQQVSFFDNKIILMSGEYNSNVGYCNLEIKDFTEMLSIESEVNAVFNFTCDNVFVSIVNSNVRVDGMVNVPGMFRLEKSNVVFQKCIVSNIRSFVSLKGGSFVEIIDSEITNVMHAIDGQEGGKIEIRDSTFTQCGNEKEEIDAITLKGHVKLNIYGSKFIANSAAIETDGHVYASDSQFSQNYNTKDGAAIDAESVEIFNCSFEFNKCQGKGGAISAIGTVQLVNTLFKSNVASDGGGAIFSQGNVIVTNCEFSSNSVVSLENQRLTGGAIWCVDTVRVHNSKFSSNSAIAGGAIYSTNALLFDSEFELNLAKGTGGAVFGDRDLQFRSCLFTNNVSNRGGSVFSASGLLKAFNCSFFYNSVNSRITQKNGVFIFKLGGTLDVQRSEFSITDYDTPEAMIYSTALRNSITSCLIDTPNFYSYPYYISLPSNTITDKRKHTKYISRDGLIHSFMFQDLLPFNVLSLSRSGELMGVQSLHSSGVYKISAAGSTHEELLKINSRDDVGTIIDGFIDPQTETAHVAVNYGRDFLYLLAVTKIGTNYLTIVPMLKMFPAWMAFIGRSKMVVMGCNAQTLAMSIQTFKRVERQVGGENITDFWEPFQGQRSVSEDQHCSLAGDAVSGDIQEIDDRNALIAFGHPAKREVKIYKLRFSDTDIFLERVQLFVEEEEEFGQSVIFVRKDEVAVSSSRSVYFYKIATSSFYNKIPSRFAFTTAERDFEAAEKIQVGSNGTHVNIFLLSNKEILQKSFAALTAPGYMYNGTTFLPCVRGTYNDESDGFGSCKLCPSGYYQDELGQTSCKRCTVPSECPPGSIWDYNGTRAEEKVSPLKCFTQTRDHEPFEEIFLTYITTSAFMTICVALIVLFLIVYWTLKITRYFRCSKRASKSLILKIETLLGAVNVLGDHNHQSHGNIQFENSSGDSPTTPQKKHVIPHRQPHAVLQGCLSLIFFYFLALFILFSILFFTSYSTEQCGDPVTHHHRFGEAGAFLYFDIPKNVIRSRDLQPAESIEYRSLAHTINEMDAHITITLIGIESSQCTNVQVIPRAGSCIYHRCTVTPEIRSFQNNTCTVDFTISGRDFNTRVAIDVVFKDTWSPTQMILKYQYQNDSQQHGEGSHSSGYQIWPNSFTEIIQLRNKTKMLYGQISRVWKRNIVLTDILSVTGAVQSKQAAVVVDAYESEGINLQEGTDQERFLFSSRSLVVELSIEENSVIEVRTIRPLIMLPDMFLTIVLTVIALFHVIHIAEFTMVNMEKFNIVPYCISCAKRYYRNMKKNRLVDSIDNDYLTLE